MMPHEQVTAADVEARIGRVEFVRLGGTITVCHLTLDNGFSVRGESGCVDPRHYNQETGERLAREKAMAKVCLLLGFLLAETRYQTCRSQAENKQPEDHSWP
jgi:hypothetical protein